jgi:hypothetical protein
MTSPCETPANLGKDGAVTTAQDLAEWAAGWIRAFGCEHGKRAGLIEAWPH